MAAVASQPFGNRSNGAFVDLSKVKGSTSPKKPKSKKTVEELEQRKKEQFRAILDNYDLECMSIVLFIADRLGCLTRSI